MINSFSFETAEDAHEGMCKRLFLGKTAKSRDWVHGTEVGLHNVAIHCKSFKYNYNYSKLWIPKSRWTMMIRQYIDREALDDCLTKIEDRMAGKYGGTKARGIAVLRSRLVAGKGSGRSVRRRWGSCMLNLSFRATPRPTISLHSRTTYFGYLASMDIGVAHAFARECGNITGIPPKNMEFVWTLDLAQFHGFRSLAWVLSKPKYLAHLDEELPNRFKHKATLVDGNMVGFRKALDGYARVKKSDDNDVLYGDEAFSSFCRIRRRFHTEVLGLDYARTFDGGKRDVKAFTKLPPVWSGDLDFSPLYR